MVEWYTFSTASKRINKNRNYFINRYRKSPEYFEPDTIKILDGIKFISDDGIEHVLNKIKKMAAHVSSNSAFVVNY
ncbi:hypothetical protein [Secundilactobacillus silagei]|mgnify:CR=1 FL=1|uniref:Uncharacterized protein n=1 Tax=Secundilactobacillus silagei JCM 19001 TaxID=1302250 RepID=A0A1Z5IK40_9LACO|nr:hypothetical protein [Secundilactobacillus silagei]TDG69950.1 hypothetical protein C5L25_002070 [Secundilactobacillus silagei JCM 19001]GAX02056.1 hypothetical protein IWT126_02120 [Secundilactobacillus silagei JCM 19001]